MTRKESYYLSNSEFMASKDFITEKVTKFIPIALPATHHLAAQKFGNHIIPTEDILTGEGDALTTNQVFSQQLLIQFGQYYEAFYRKGGFSQNLVPIVFYKPRAVELIPFVPDPYFLFETPDTLISIYDSFLDKYTAPKSEKDLLLHLWAAHLFYSIIVHLAVFSTELFLRFDAAFSKIAFNVGKCVQEFIIKGTREKDRLDAANKQRNDSTAKRKQKVLELYFTLEQREKLGDYAAATLIKKRWDYNDGKEPSDSSIVRWIRAEKRPKLDLQT